jgi:hypothetical protein
MRQWHASEQHRLLRMQATLLALLATLLALVARELYVEGSLVSLSTCTSIMASLSPLARL